MKPATVRLLVACGGAGYAVALASTTLTGSPPRARFAGQKPLIEIRRDDEPILHRELVTGSTLTPSGCTSRSPTSNAAAPAWFSIKRTVEGRK